MANVSSHVTACLTSASVTNFLPATCLLRVQRDGYHWAPYCQPDVQLFTVLWLGLYANPPYGSDLLPGAFHLRGNLQNKMATKRLATDAEVKKAVTSWLQTLHTDLFYARIQMLVPQCQRRNKVFGIRAFVTLFTETSLPFHACIGS